MMIPGTSGVMIGALAIAVECVRNMIRSVRSKGDTVGDSFARLSTQKPVREMCARRSIECYGRLARPNPQVLSSATSTMNSAVAWGMLRNGE